MGRFRIQDLGFMNKTGRIEKLPDSLRESGSFSQFPKIKNLPQSSRLNHIGSLVEKIFITVCSVFVQFPCVVGKSNARVGGDARK